MFKFIHAADIHLDSPLKGLERYDGAPVERLRQATRRALENLVGLAVRERVDFVIIAGDLFDTDWKDYNTGLYFVQQMSRLNVENIPVFLLKGNHDAESRISKSLPLPDNVRTFSSKKPETFHIDSCRVALHGQSFATGAVTEDISLGYPAAEAGKFNIGVLHTCAAGREGHAPYAPCKIEGLIAKGYNYWALGHVHKREILNQDPFIIFPGNIQGRHARETGPKGCSLVTVDDRQQISENFEELAVMRWEHCRVDASGSKSYEDVLQKVRESVENELDRSKGLPLALRIEITGACEADSYLRSGRNHFIESARSIAIQSAPDQVWIEKIKIRTSPPMQMDTLPLHDGPVYELLNYIEEIKASDQELSSLQHELSELRSKLPADLPETNELANIEWYRNALDDVRQILLERLLQPGALK